MKIIMTRKPLEATAITPNSLTRDHADDVLICLMIRFRLIRIHRRSRACRLYARFMRFVCEIMWFSDARLHK